MLILKKKRRLMETINIKPVSIIHGVQGIIQVMGGDRSAQGILSQEYLIIQDHDDRGLGTGICKCGLPGGRIEKGEIPIVALLRELREEVAISFEASSFNKIGSFTKKRPGGFTNDNHLFYTRLDYRPKKKTNDPREVSEVYIFSFREILYLARFGRFHEGSIRLLFHFLNGIKSGSLNEVAHFYGYSF
jgi:8-oxo-dGTP pyrophosphatase MutT (NUDIX family)